MNEKQLLAYRKSLLRRAKEDEAILRVSKRIRTAQPPAPEKITLPKKRGRPARQHAGTNEAWRTTLCAKIALNLHREQGAKIQHAIRAALKTLKDCTLGNDDFDFVIEDASLRRAVDQLRKGGQPPHALAERAKNLNRKKAVIKQEPDRWKNVTGDSVRQQVYRIERGESKPVEPSPGLMQRAAANLAITSTKKINAAKKL